MSARTAPARCAFALGVALLGIGAGSSAPSRAQSAGGAYRLEPVVVAGGATLAAGGFRISATLAQPATATLAAGPWRLHGGYWAARGSDRIFADGFDLTHP